MLFVVSISATGLDFDEELFVVLLVVFSLNFGGLLVGCAVFGFDVAGA